MVGQRVATRGDLARNWALFVMLLSALAVVALPASAIERDATVAEIEQAACLSGPYLDLASGTVEKACESQKFLSSSAAIKCHLYVDAGYPSAMMRRACQLFDKGYVLEISGSKSASN